MEFLHPALPQAEPLEGSEPIAFEGRTLATVQDFWRWAYSNLNDNASRGRFAEFVVAAALGCASGTRTEWDPYDILWNDIKIEVKSSAYLQSWAQRRLSRIEFGIQPTREWDEATGDYVSEPKRQADVYVFCLETCREQTPGNPNPLDLGQWEFYVLATKALEPLGAQKTISLAGVRELGAERIESAFELAESVLRASRTS